MCHTACRPAELGTAGVNAKMKTAAGTGKARRAAVFGEGAHNASTYHIEAIELGDRSELAPPSNLRVALSDPAVVRGNLWLGGAYHADMSPFRTWWVLAG